jgi:hypothetical protein
MTPLLQQAFTEAAKLSDSEQEVLWLTACQCRIDAIGASDGDARGDSDSFEHALTLAGHGDRGNRYEGTRFQDIMRAQKNEPTEAQRHGDTENNKTENERETSTRNFPDFHFDAFSVFSSRCLCASVVHSFSLLRSCPRQSQLKLGT